MRDLIVFDLDGTLVDSRDEIVSSFERAFHETCPELAFDPSRVRIGPPLSAIVDALAPSLDEDRRTALADAFRRHYDTSDFSATSVYPGIEDVLVELASQGKTLAVATNKRRVPTLAILARHFPNRFSHVATIDGVVPDDGTHPGNKAKMLAWLSRAAPNEAGRRVMIGDTAADVEAGRAEGYATIAVTWGYGKPEELRLARPDAVASAAPDLRTALGALRAT